MPVQASLTCQSTQLAEQIMRRWHAAILIHFVSGGLVLGLCFILSVFSKSKFFFFFILSIFLYDFFRLEPSTVSTLRSPHRDSQTPSDSHLLHHQQGRGPGRVSKRKLPNTQLSRVYFNFTQLQLQTLQRTGPLSNGITEDLTPCKGTPNSFFQDLFIAP